MFFNKDTRKRFRSPKYRLALALYGACGFLLSALSSTYYDPQIFDLASKAGKYIGDVRPEYPWGYYVLWLTIPLFLAVYFGPHLAEKLLKKQIKDSLGLGLFVFMCYAVLCSMSLLNFGANRSLVIEFVGFGFIIASTEFLKGFQIDFSFASDSTISQQARIRKIEFLHKKWFDAIGALLTVSVAVLITGALKLTEIWQQQFGSQGADVFTRSIGMQVVYAGAGLALGPFNLMFKILAEIEDQLEKIESI